MGLLSGGNGDGIDVLVPVPGGCDVLGPLFPGSEVITALLLSSGLSDGAPKSSSRLILVWPLITVYEPMPCIPLPLTVNFLNNSTA